MKNRKHREYSDGKRLGTSNALYYICDEEGKDPFVSRVNEKEEFRQLKTVMNTQPWTAQMGVADQI